MRTTEANLTRRLVNIVFFAGLGAGYLMVVRPKMLSAGATMDEVERPLPGDEVIVTPNFQATRAININAPVEIVWPWIAQMGRDTTGFYALDSISNRGLPSAAYI